VRARDTTKEENSMTLEQRLWNALNAMQLLSNGATTRLDTDRVHGSRNPGLYPAGEQKCEFLIFQRRFAQAHSYQSKLEIVEEAERDLAQWTHSRPPKDPEHGSYFWKVMLATSKDSVTDLARRHSVSRQMIYVYRRRYGNQAA
jgi:hypothetical protein